MSAPDEAAVAVLRAAVALCRRQPELLQATQCEFFRDFASELASGGGGPRPAAAAEPAGERVAAPRQATDPVGAAPALRVNPFNVNALFSCEWSDGESSVEEAPQQQQQQQERMSEDEGDAAEHALLRQSGDESRSEQAASPAEEHPSEGGMLQAAQLVGEAQYASLTGSHSRALNLINQAVALDPSHAVLYVERAEVHLRMRRPQAAVRDCDHALRVNPDSAGAHKARGRAYRMLKNWELSAHHLRLATQLVYDEGGYALQKRVESKVKERRLEEVRQRIESTCSEEA
eukprot:Hpha_TRINITY_DN15638_c5_g8::TRINITY_DN15638_c5_g8_i1::g.98341::m.98341/K09560/ST13; suppressor of tumorigenicity protein 13